MSEELVKGAAEEVTAESPLEGTSQSSGDVSVPVDTEAQLEQDAASVGVFIEENEAEDTAEEGLTPIANEVVEQDSFWSGFFGTPVIPRVGQGE